jgi:antitoxin VapB
MALNIKNKVVEELATEVSRMAGETKTEAIRQALVERKLRLQTTGATWNRTERLLQFLEQSVWPNIPPGELGRVLTREEEDDILGFGPDGV